MKDKYGKYREVEHTGLELLEMGVNSDAYSNPIEANDSYLIRLYDESRTKIVLSKKDWEVRKHLQIYEEIKKQGLKPWVNLGFRLGFFDKNSDYEEAIEAVVDSLTHVEWFEDAIKLKSDLIDLIQEDREKYGSAAN